MSPEQMLQECDREIARDYADLPRPEQKELAQLVSGVVLAESCVLPAISAALPGEITNRSKERRAQRLLANPRLEVSRLQRRLIQRVFQGRHGRVDLYLDATTTGGQQGTVTLCLAAAWHGRAIPLIWRTWKTREEGQEWQQAICEMCQQVEALRPQHSQVVLMADRGLSGEHLVSTACAVNWHFLVRVQGTTRIEKKDGTVCSLEALTTAPGIQQCWSQVWLYGPRNHHRGKGRRWQEGHEVNVVVVWDHHAKEPWALVTDLPASVARCREYRHRTWEEELFRDLKSMGWQWQKSKIHAPERVSRLIGILALATLWIIALAQRVRKRGWRVQIEERSRRCYSWFQLGLRWCKRQLTGGGWVPCSFSLWEERRAPLAW